MDQIGEKLEFLKQLINSFDWQTVKQTDNICTQKKFLPESKFACFRSFGTVNSTPPKLMDFVWQLYGSSDYIKKHDPEILDYYILETINENSRICYQINNMPWPIWPRDCIYLQHKYIDNDGIGYIFMYSINTNVNQEQNNKCVRAIIDISAYVFQPYNGWCKVYRIAHINPAGSIPASVVNNYATKTRSIIEILRNNFGN